MATRGRNPANSAGKAPNSVAGEDGVVIAATQTDLMSNDELWPPNPKELLIAIFTFFSRALFGT
jgi:hypothetical protein